MKLALLGKVIGDAKWLFLALLALMLFFPWVFLWISGKISMPAFSKFLTSALPKEWQQRIHSMCRCDEGGPI